MIINYGLIINDKMILCASKEYNHFKCEISEIGMQIAEDYILFKNMTDQYGHVTYLELPRQTTFMDTCFLTQVQSWIDQYLDSKEGVSSIWSELHLEDFSE